MIKSKVLKVAQIEDNRKEEMYQLYSTYYGGTDRALFLADLHEKDHAIILADETQSIQGFSTLKTIETALDGEPVRAIFSGDTIVNHRYWGKNDLALSWLRHAGQIKSSSPLPLYWFLIVKGHRTYRYLSIFSHRYYPAPGIDTPLRLKGLMDYLSTQMFGDAYDRSRGILHFSDPRGFLQEEWAEIPQRDQKLSEVRFFLEQNPGYQQGDELVCLCELTEDNLRPLAKRLFKRNHGTDRSHQN